MRRFTNPLWVLLVVSCCFSRGFAQNASPLFPDKNLQAAVRSQVFATEPLNEESVRKLSVLKASGSEIRDITGLEKCTALAMLDLSNNQITDLSPLKGLTGIQSLTLSGNKIRDLAPLSGLTNLQYLELTGNEISDLTPVSNLTALASL